MKGASAVATVLSVLSAYALAAAEALAQEGPLALVLCRKVSADQDRLKCYDAAIDAAFSSRVKPDREMPKIGVWRIEEEKSPIDDSAEVSALLAATVGDGQLIARCKERKTELAISPDSFYIGSVASKGVKTVIRVNDAPAVTEMWSPSTNGQAAFSQTPIQTLKALPDMGRLFIRVFDFRGASRDSTFDLGTVSEVREKIRQTCNWPETRPPSKVSPTAGKPP